MCRCTLALVLIAGPLSAAPQEHSAAQDLKNIQGVWNLVGGAVEGNKLTAGDVKKDGQFFIQFTFKGSRMIHKESGNLRKQSTFRLLPGKKPRGLNLIPLAGRQRNKVIPGVYQLKEDRLLICLAAVDGERPTKFEAASGSGHKLFVQERVKSK